MRYHATSKGRIPFTEAEERERDKEEADWEVKRPEKEYKRKLKKLTNKLKNMGVEGIIDSMDIDQQKRLPLAMQEQYDEIKQLRENN